MKRYLKSIVIGLVLIAGVVFAGEWLQTDSTNRFYKISWNEYDAGGPGTVWNAYSDSVDNLYNKVWRDAPINVKSDYGAIGDGVTDDTAAIQAAIDSDAQDIIIPEGTFLCNVTVDGYVNIRGMGPKSILKAKTADPIIIVSERITGLFPGRRFFDFKLDGNSTSKGIFYSAKPVEDDIIGVTFVDCTRGIDYGATGPIGNFVRYCSFKDSDYGIYAKADSGVSGINLNLIEKNRFYNIAKAAIYLDGTDQDAQGNEINGNWFETLPGFAIILKGTRLGVHPNRIRGGWFESVATSTPITLDDEGAVTSYAVWLLDTTLISEGGTFPPKSLVDGTHLMIDHYRGSASAADNNVQPTLQNNSRMTIEDAIFDSTGGSSIVSPAGGIATVRRPITFGSTKKGFLVEGPPMAHNVGGYTSTAGIQTLTVNAAATLAYQNTQLFGSGVRRITLPSNADFVTDSVTVNDGKYCAYSFSIKSSTSTDEDDIRFTITGNGILQGNLTLRAKGELWTHYMGVVYAGATAPTVQTLRFYTLVASTFDISRLQFLEFSTAQEAENYLHNQQFAISSTKFNTLGNDATPNVISDEARSLWLTGGVIAITDFDDGYEGQIITIISDHGITIDADAGNIFPPGGIDKALVANDSISFLCKADNKWYCIAYSDNTP